MRDFSINYTAATAHTAMFYIRDSKYTCGKLNHSRSLGCIGQNDHTLRALQSCRLVVERTLTETDLDIDISTKWCNAHWYTNINMSRATYYVYRTHTRQQMNTENQLQILYQQGHEKPSPCRNPTIYRHEVIEMPGKSVQTYRIWRLTPLDLKPQFRHLHDHLQTCTGGTKALNRKRKRPPLSASYLNLKTEHSVDIRDQSGMWLLVNMWPLSNVWQMWRKWQRYLRENFGRHVGSSWAHHCRAISTTDGADGVTLTELNYIE
jgi:hypothetical protein